MDPKLGKRKQNESALIKYDLKVMWCICIQSLNPRKTQMKATTKEKSKNKFFFTSCHNC